MRTLTRTDVVVGAAAASLHLGGAAWCLQAARAPGRLDGLTQAA